MKSKLVSLLTACMLVSSSAPIPYVQASAPDPMDSVIGTLPDWTPMNFIDAMEFYNTYGKTHVEDNFICLVKPMRLDEKDKYITSKIIQYVIFLGCVASLLSIFQISKGTLSIENTNFSDILQASYLLRKPVF